MVCAENHSRGGHYRPTLICFEGYAISMADSVSLRAKLTMRCFENECVYPKTI